MLKYWEYVKILSFKEEILFNCVPSTKLNSHHHYTPNNSCFIYIFKFISVLLLAQFFHVSIQIVKEPHHLDNRGSSDSDIEDPCHGFPTLSSLGYA